MAADSGGGNVINWVKTVLAGCDTDEAFFRQAGRAEAGCQGLGFELSGDASRGAWRNAGFHHSPADFARSVLECLTRRLVRLFHQLGRPTTAAPILVSGGGSANPIWMRMLAEALGARLRVIEAPPFVGAARMVLAGPRDRVKS